MRSAFWLPVGIALAATATASEVTVQNDSLGDGGQGTIEAGFVANEKAAAWLTTPCDGNIVAVDIFWRSQFGTAPVAIEDSIDIYRAGTFPVPGDLAEEIGGPVLTDGVLNEYRYLDENNTIPLIVPVVQDETFVVALTFADAPDSTGPSVVIDGDGVTPNANAIYASLGGGAYQWFSNTALGVNGDWVIRAVVDCQSVSTEADVAVAMTADPPQYTAGAPLTYTITISNAGPAASSSTTVVDAFPADYDDVTWTCAPSGGASCPASGTGTIAGSVSLPSGSAVVFTVDGTVAAGMTGTLSNSATAVVGAPQTDPDPTNNSITLDVDPVPVDDDTIFADGFDG
jgi:uncharacterized repeat protein (TIGR01451 family)